MSVDSTFNDTDNASGETEDQAPSSAISGAPSSPKPPRPAKRPAAFARVPMPDAFRPPSSSSPRSFEEDAAPPSPASGVPERDLGSAFPLTAHRPKAPSTPPVDDGFGGLEPIASERISDRAPNAPVTPWANVPALVSAPPVREADASDSSPPVGIEPEDERDDREETIVGEVPRRLLEMSSGDENTRAYTAPQELIELARRKREERLKAKGAPAATAAAQAATAEVQARETERPPARRRPLESIPEESFEDVMPNDPPQAGDHFEEDSAPAIERPASGPPDRDPPLVSFVPKAAAVPKLSTPATAAPPQASSAAPSKVASAAPPVSNSMLDRLYGSVPAPKDSVRAAGNVELSEPAPESEQAALSAQQTSWSIGARRWVIVIGLFIAIGVVLARWRGLERFLLH